MIIREELSGGVLAVAQPDHAALAGRLAQAWDDALTPAFRSAVAHHDDVWAARDAAPPWNPATGWPQTFLELSPGERRAVWERASELAAPLGAEAELWVLRHAERLHAQADEAGLETMTAGFSARAAELVEELRVAHGARFDDTTLARGTSLLALLDTLSLWLCFGVHERVAAGVLTLAPHQDGVAVAPWPFTGRRVVTFLEGRRLAGAAGAQGELDAAWATAPGERVAVVLTPAG